MLPDDPRHGKVAGASQHRRDNEALCDPCRVAANRDRKRYRYLAAVGKSPTIDARGIVRRVRGLQALGWTLPQIADAAGISFTTLQKPLYRSGTCRPATAVAIIGAYERLCMTHPPEDTAQQRRDARYARTIAGRNGWPPPLAWDNIDDPAEKPQGMLGQQKRRDPDDLDPAVVERLLTGQRESDATRAERVAAMTRWLAWGRSEKSLCQMHGWHDGRYVVRERVAS